MDVPSLAVPGGLAALVAVVGGVWLKYRKSLDARYDRFIRIVEEREQDCVKKLDRLQKQTAKVGGLDELHVLILEDNEGDCELLCRYLLDVPGRPRVRVTSTLREAVRAIEDEGPFDVAIVDLGLPDAHGDEVPERLLELDACPPLVVVSGAENGDRSERLRGLGVLAYLEKEKIRTPALFRAIRKATVRRPE